MVSSRIGVCLALFAAARYEGAWGRRFRVAGMHVGITVQLALIGNGL